MANSSVAVVSNRPRLEFLDGLRGISALAVVFAHMLAIQNLTLPPALLHWIGACAHFAVVIFIVLSGYCLMMPVAASATGEMQSVTGFFVRRARRILPPYYVALFAALAFAELIAHKHHQHLDRNDVLAHLFLVHNLSRAWYQGFCGPLWSVPVEWQIYFLMPFVFLPIWRAAGSAAAVAIGLAIGYLPHILLPTAWNFDWSCPWFAGLFALGMLGASATFTGDSHKDRWLRGLPWAPIALAATAALFAVYWGVPLLRDQFWALDPICGLAALAAIVHSALAMRSATPRMTPLASICESKPALTIGMFSYSLYLIHLTTLKVFDACFGKHIPSPDKLMMIHIFIAGPIILCVSYAFYRLIEKPFMTSHRSFRFVGVHREDLPAATAEATKTAA